MHRLGDDLQLTRVAGGSACVSVLTVLVRTDRELRKEGSVITDRWLFNTIGTTVALAAPSCWR